MTDIFTDLIKHGNHYTIYMLIKSSVIYLKLTHVNYILRVKLKSLSHATLCNPMDYTVHGILQARILEWVAFPFSRVSSQTQWNSGFPHCMQILYQLNHQGSSSVLTELGGKLPDML